MLYTGQLLATLILNFTGVYYFLKLFMDFASYRPITALELLLPTIVFSSAVVALFNYIEAKRNTRDTVLWKQKEQTVQLLKTLETDSTVFAEILSEPIIVKSFNKRLNYDDVVSKMQSLRKLHQKENPKTYHMYRDRLIRASNMYENIAIQYHYDLLDKTMTKQLYYAPYVKHASMIQAIIQGYAGDLTQPEHLELLKEWDINYKDIQ